MLHHISMAVTNVERSARFYDAALGALGYVRVWADADAVGHGYAGGGDELALKQRDCSCVPGDGFHVAFAAMSTDAVDQFHAAALRHGGTDNGGPGSGRSTAPAITPPSCWTRTAIGSRP